MNSDLLLIEYCDCYAWYLRLLRRLKKLKLVFKQSTGIDPDAPIDGNDKPSTQDPTNSPKKDPITVPSNPDDKPIPGGGGNDNYYELQLPANTVVNSSITNGSEFSLSTNNGLMKLSGSPLNITVYDSTFNPQIICYNATDGAVYGASVNDNQNTIYYYKANTSGLSVNYVPSGNVAITETDTLADYIQKLTRDTDDAYSPILNSLYASGTNTIVAYDYIYYYKLNSSSYNINYPKDTVGHLFTVRNGAEALVVNRDVVYLHSSLVTESNLMSNIEPLKKESGSYVNYACGCYGNGKYLLFSSSTVAGFDYYDTQSDDAHTIYTIRGLDYSCQVVACAYGFGYFLGACADRTVLAIKDDFSEIVQYNVRMTFDPADIKFGNNVFLITSKNDNNMLVITQRLFGFVPDPDNPYPPVQPVPPEEPLPDPIPPVEPTPIDPDIVGSIYLDGNDVQFLLTANNGLFTSSIAKSWNTLTTEYFPQLAKYGFRGSVPSSYITAFQTNSDKTLLMITNYGGSWATKTTTLNGNVTSLFTQANETTLTSWFTVVDENGVGKGYSLTNGSTARPTDVLPSINNIKFGVYSEIDANMKYYCLKSGMVIKPITNGNFENLITSSFNLTCGVCRNSNTVIFGENSKYCHTWQNGNYALQTLTNVFNIVDASYGGGYYVGLSTRSSEGCYVVYNNDLSNGEWKTLGLNIPYDVSKISFANGYFGILCPKQKLVYTFYITDFNGGFEPSPLPTCPGVEPSGPMPDVDSSIGFSDIAACEYGYALVNANGVYVSIEPETSWTKISDKNNISYLTYEYPHGLLYGLSGNGSTATVQVYDNKWSQTLNSVSSTLTNISGFAVVNSQVFRFNNDDNRKNNYISNYVWKTSLDIRRAYWNGSDCYYMEGNTINRYLFSKFTISGNTVTETDTVAASYNYESSAGTFLNDHIVIFNQSYNKYEYTTLNGGDDFVRETFPSNIPSSTIIISAAYGGGHIIGLIKGTTSTDYTLNILHGIVDESDMAFTWSIENIKSFSSSFEPKKIVYSLGRFVVIPTNGINPLVITFPNDPDFPKPPTVVPTPPPYNPPTKETYEPVEASGTALQINDIAGNFNTTSGKYMFNVVSNNLAYLFSETGLVWSSLSGSSYPAYCTDIISNTILSAIYKTSTNIQYVQYNNTTSTNTSLTPLTSASDMVSFSNLSLFTSDGKLNMIRTTSTAFNKNVVTSKISGNTLSTNPNTRATAVINDKTISLYKPFHAANIDKPTKTFTSTYSLTCVCYGYGDAWFLAFGPSNRYIILNLSSSSITESTIPTTVISSVTPLSCAYGWGYYVVIPDQSDASNYRIIYGKKSNSSITWNTYQLSAIAFKPYKVAYSNGVFVITPQNGKDFIVLRPKSFIEPNETLPTDPSRGTDTTTFEEEEEPDTENEAKTETVTPISSGSCQDIAGNEYNIALLCDGKLLMSNNGKTNWNSVNSESNQKCISFNEYDQVFGAYNGYIQMLNSDNVWIEYLKVNNIGTSVNYSCLNVNNGSVFVLENDSTLFNMGISLEAQPTSQSAEFTVYQSQPIPATMAKCDGTNCIIQNITFTQNKPSTVTNVRTFECNATCGTYMTSKNAYYLFKGNNIFIATTSTTTNKAISIMGTSETALSAASGGSHIILVSRVNSTSANLYHGYYREGETELRWEKVTVPSGFIPKKVICAQGRFYVMPNNGSNILIITMNSLTQTEPTTKPTPPPISGGGNTYQPSTPPNQGSVTVYDTAGLVNTTSTEPSGYLLAMVTSDKTQLTSNGTWTSVNSITTYGLPEKVAFNSSQTLVGIGRKGTNAALFTYSGNTVTAYEIVISNVNTASSSIAAFQPINNSYLYGVGKELYFYKPTDINNIFSTYTSTQDVKCISLDPYEKNIVVGFSGGDILKFYPFHASMFKNAADYKTETGLTTITCSCYGNDKFVIFGTKDNKSVCYVLTSSSSKTITIDTNVITSCAYGAGYYVGIDGNNQKLYYSTDTETWKTISPTFGFVPNKIVFTNGTAIGYKYGAFMLSSSNGSVIILKPPTFNNGVDPSKPPTESGGNYEEEQPEVNDKNKPNEETVTVSNSNLTFNDIAGSDWDIALISSDGTYHVSSDGTVKSLASGSRSGAIGYDIDGTLYGLFDSNNYVSNFYINTWQQYVNGVSSPTNVYKLLMYNGYTFAYTKTINGFDIQAISTTGNKTGNISSFTSDFAIKASQNTVTLLYTGNSSSIQSANYTLANTITSTSGPSINVANSKSCTYDSDHNCYYVFGGMNCYVISSAISLVKTSQYTTNSSLAVSSCAYGMNHIVGIIEGSNTTIVCGLVGADNSIEWNVATLTSNINTFKKVIYAQGKFYIMPVSGTQVLVISFSGDTFTPPEKPKDKIPEGENTYKENDITTDSKTHIMITGYRSFVKANTRAITANFAILNNDRTVYVSNNGVGTWPADPSLSSSYTPAVIGFNRDRDIIGLSYSSSSKNIYSELLTNPVTNETITVTENGEIPNGVFPIAVSNNTMTLFTTNNGIYAYRPYEFLDKLLSCDIGNMKPMFMLYNPITKNVIVAGKYTNSDGTKVEYGLIAFNPFYVTTMNTDSIWFDGTIDESVIVCGCYGHAKFIIFLNDYQTIIIDANDMTTTTNNRGETVINYTWGEFETSDYIISCAYGMGIYVGIEHSATGKINNELAYSTDGSTWKTLTVTMSFVPYQIAFSNGVFVIIPQTGKESLVIQPKVFNNGVTPTDPGDGDNTPYDGEKEGPTENEVPSFILSELPSATSNEVLNDIAGSDWGISVVSSAATYSVDVTDSFKQVNTTSMKCASYDENGLLYGCNASDVYSVNNDAWQDTNMNLTLSLTSNGVPFYVRNGYAFVDDDGSLIGGGYKTQVTFTSSIVDFIMLPNDLVLVAMDGSSGLKCSKITYNSGISFGTATSGNVTEKIAKLVYDNDRDRVYVFKKDSKSIDIFIGSTYTSKNATITLDIDDNITITSAAYGANHIVCLLSGESDKVLCGYITSEGIKFSMFPLTVTVSSGLKKVIYAQGKFYILPVSGNSVVKISFADITYSQPELPTTAIKVPIGEETYVVNNPNISGEATYDELDGYWLDKVGESGWIVTVENSSTYNPDIGHVYSLLYDPDRKRYVAGGSDVSNQFNIFDVMSNEWISKQPSGIRDIYALAYDPDRKRYIVGGIRPPYCRMYDIESETWLDIPDPNIGDIMKLFYDPDRKRYVAGGYRSPYFNIYDIEGNKWLNPSDPDIGSIWTLLYDPDRKRYVAGGSEEPYCRMYDIESETWLDIPDPNIGSVHALLYDPDRKRYVAGGFNEPYFNIYDVEGNKWLNPPDPNIRDIYTLAYDSDKNRYVAGGDLSPYFNIYDIEGNKWLNPSDPNIGYIRPLLYDPDRKRYVAGGYNEPYINIYDIGQSYSTTEPNFLVTTTNDYVYSSITGSDTWSSLSKVSLTTSPSVYTFNRSNSIFGLGQLNTAPTNITLTDFSSSNSLLTIPDTSSLGQPTGFTLYDVDGSQYVFFTTSSNISVYRPERTVDPLLTKAAPSGFTTQFLLWNPLSHNTLIVCSNGKLLGYKPFHVKSLNTPLTYTPTSTLTYTCGCYGNGAFILHTSDKRVSKIASSGSSITVTTTSTQNFANQVISCAYGFGFYLAIEASSNNTINNQIAYSTDGSTWQTKYITMYFVPYKITFSNGVFVVIPKTTSDQFLILKPEMFGTVDAPEDPDTSFEEDEPDADIDVKPGDDTYKDFDPEITSGTAYLALSGNTYSTETTNPNFALVTNEKKIYTSITGTGIFTSFKSIDSTDEDFSCLSLASNQTILEISNSTSSDKRISLYLVLNSKLYDTGIPSDTSQANNIHALPFKTSYYALFTSASTVSIYRPERQSNNLVAYTPSTSPQLSVFNPKSHKLIVPTSEKTILFYEPLHVSNISKPTVKTYTTDYAISCGCYGNGIFNLFTTDKKVLSFKYDSFTSLISTTVTSTNYVVSCAYGMGIFVAIERSQGVGVINNELLYYNTLSSNPSWQTMTITLNYVPFQIAFSNGVFIIIPKEVGEKFTVLYPKMFNNGTTPTAPTDPDDEFQEEEAETESGDNTFTEVDSPSTSTTATNIMIRSSSISPRTASSNFAVLLSDGSLSISTSGSTWSAVSAPTHIPKVISYNDENIVYGLTNSNTIYRTVFGTTTTETQVTTINSTIMDSITFNVMDSYYSLFITSNGSLYVYRPDRVVDPVLTTALTDSPSLREITINPVTRAMIMTTSTGTIYGYSPFHVKSMSSPLKLSITNSTLRCACYGADSFIIHGSIASTDQVYIIKSSDMASSTANTMKLTNTVTTTPSAHVISCAYGMGIFVAIEESSNGINNELFYSLDFGVTWKTKNITITITPYQIAFSNGVFVIIPSKASDKYVVINPKLFGTVTNIPSDGDEFEEDEPEADSDLSPSDDTYGEYFLEDYPSTNVAFHDTAYSTKTDYIFSMSSGSSSKYYFINENGSVTAQLATSPISTALCPSYDNSMVYGFYLDTNTIKMNKIQGTTSALITSNLVTNIPSTVTPYNARASQDTFIVKFDNKYGANLLTSPLDTPLTGATSSSNGILNVDGTLIDPSNTKLLVTYNFGPYSSIGYPLSSKSFGSLTFTNGASSPQYVTFLNNYYIAFNNSTVYVSNCNLVIGDTDKKISTFTLPTINNETVNIISCAYNKQLHIYLAIQASDVMFYSYDACTWYRLMLTFELTPYKVTDGNNSFMITPQQGRSYVIIRKDAFTTLASNITNEVNLFPSNIIPKYGQSLSWGSYNNIISTSSGLFMSSSLGYFMSDNGFDWLWINSKYKPDLMAVAPNGTIWGCYHDSSKVYLIQYDTATHDFNSVNSISSTVTSVPISIQAYNDGIKVIYDSSMFTISATTSNKLTSYTKFAVDMTNNRMVCYYGTNVTGYATFSFTGNSSSATNISYNTTYMASINEIIYNDSYWMLFSNTHVMRVTYTSTFTIVGYGELPSNGVISSAAVGGSRYVAIQSGNKLLYTEGSDYQSWKSFNLPNIETWNCVTYVGDKFIITPTTGGKTLLVFTLGLNNQPSVSYLKMRSLYNGTSTQPYVFENATSPIDISTLSGLQTLKNCTCAYNTQTAFSHAEVQISNLNYLDMRNVMNLNGMFSYSTTTSLSGINSWITNNFVDMRGMFSSCTKLASLDLSSWNICNAQNMSELFYNCSKLTTINSISNWDMSNVVDISRMFALSGITAISINDWNLSSLEYSDELFESCVSLETVDLSKWLSLSLVKTFKNCTSLKNVNITKIPFDATASETFSGCTALTEINIASWNITTALSVDVGIFTGCNALEKIYCTDTTFTNIQVTLPTPNKWTYDTEGEFAYKISTSDLVEDIAIHAEGVTGSTVWNLSSVYNNGNLSRVSIDSSVGVITSNDYGKTWYNSYAHDDIDSNIITPVYNPTRTLFGTTSNALLRNLDTNADFSSIGTVSTYIRSQAFMTQQNDVVQAYNNTLVGIMQGTVPNQYVPTGFSGETLMARAPNGTTIVINNNKAYYYNYLNAESIYDIHPCVFTSTSPKTLKSVVYGNNKFMLLSTLDDDITGFFTIDVNQPMYVTLARSNSLSFSCIAYGHGYFVALSSNVLLYSTNGSTWIEKDDFSSSITPSSMIYVNGYFIVIPSFGNVFLRINVNYLIEGTEDELQIEPVESTTIKYDNDSISANVGSTFAETFDKIGMNAADCELLTNGS